MSVCYFPKCEAAALYELMFVALDIFIKCC